MFQPWAELSACGSIIHGSPILQRMSVAAAGRLQLLAKRPQMSRHIPCSRAGAVLVLTGVLWVLLDVGITLPANTRC